jgi:hypothetical protein
METLDQMRAVVGDPAVTNALLVWLGLELRRAVPLMRALVKHFKLEPQPTENQ